MPKPKQSKLSPRQHAQSIAYLALVVGGILSYVAAEIILAVRPHPYHWLMALVGGVLIGLIVFGVAWWQWSHRA